MVSLLHDGVECSLGHAPTVISKDNTMDTLLAIGMTTTMVVVGMWLYSSFKWQGWGKI
jgi:hypothetical protein